MTLPARVVENKVPSELRQLVFESEEVVQAVRKLYRRRGQSMPRGNVLATTPEADESGEISALRMVFTDAPVVEWMPPDTGGGDRQEIRVEAPALAAALIMHCREERIPLPARARKSLRLVGGLVCLIIAVGDRRADDSSSVPDAA